MNVQPLSYFRRCKLISDNLFQMRKKVAHPVYAGFTVWSSRTSYTFSTDLRARQVQQGV